MSSLCPLVTLIAPPDPQVQLLLDGHVIPSDVTLMDVMYMYPHQVSSPFFNCNILELKLLQHYSKS